MNRARNRNRTRSRPAGARPAPVLADGLRVGQDVTPYPAGGGGGRVHGVDPTAPCHDPGRGPPAGRRPPAETGDHGAGRASRTPSPPASAPREARDGRSRPLGEHASRVGEALRQHRSLAYRSNGAGQAALVRARRCASSTRESTRRRREGGDCPPARGSVPVQQLADKAPRGAAVRRPRAAAVVAVRRPRSSTRRGCGNGWHLSQRRSAAEVLPDTRAQRVGRGRAPPAGDRHATGRG